MTERFSRYEPEHVIAGLAELAACAWPHVSTDTLADVVVAMYRGDRAQMWEGANTLSYEQDRMAQRCVRFLGPMTLEQVGAALGVSRERVRQIESALLRRIRNKAKMSQWQPEPMGPIGRRKR